MAKKVTVFVLLALMALGVAIALVNFISADVDAAPCVQVKYHADPPDCYGSGTTCWDCTGTKPPID